MTKSKFPPILLTSCVIISDHSAALKDEKYRIKYTLESIRKWLNIDPNIKLVICDGSSFDFSGIVSEAFPDASIECLNFRNSADLVALYGKGYGEGEIVNFAISHSEFLAEADCFAKCTSKLWVENFAECFETWNKKFLCHGYFENVFSIRETNFSYVDTRFYLANKIFYTANFSSAHLKLMGETGLSIEHCFRDIILEKNYEKILFSLPPVVCGVGGGSGVYYKNNIKRRLKDILRLRIVKAHKSFRPLFN